MTGKASKKNSKRRNRRGKRSMKGELKSDDLPGDLMAKKRTSSSSQGTETEGEEVSNNLPDDLLAKMRMLSTCKATETEGQEVSKELPEDLRETMRTLSGGKATETEGEMIYRDLPEHLVETIISKLPFPHIFKARALSRAWLARLSSISSHEDEVNRGLATSFQNLVRESSHNWETFCAVWFGNGINSISKFAYNKDSRDNSFAYDQASRTWRRLPSLSFLPSYMCLSRTRLQIEGALLYGPAWLKRESNVRLFVANIFTKSWKILPPRNNAREDRKTVWKKLVSDTLLGYKMIMVNRYWHGEHSFNYSYSAEVYNSNSDAWTTKEIDILMEFEESTHFEEGTVAYLNGVVYIRRSFRNFANPRRLSIFAFSVEEGTVDVVNVSLGEASHYANDNSNLVSCNGTLMVILTFNRSSQIHKCEYQRSVFEVDLKSRRLLLVARIPHALEGGWTPSEPFNAGGGIFFRESRMYFRDIVRYNQGRKVVEGERSISYRVLKYNVDKTEWSCFEVPSIGDSRRWREQEWSTSCFQPGLNPFMEA